MVRDPLESEARSEAPAAICGIKEAQCVCMLAQDHAPPHECECGGKWTFDEAGHFLPVAWPQQMMAGPFAGQKTPFADDPVDVPLLALWHLLGGDDE